MEEIWKDIKGYEGLYQVSNLGRVKALCRVIKSGRGLGNHIYKERILSLSKRNNGYLKATLCKDGVYKYISVHRLVAENFIDNPNSLKEVNHKNEIKTDNRVENLEWCNRKYNANYGTARKRASIKCNKRVLQFDNNGKYIKTWHSLTEVSKTLKIRLSSLSQCCNGKYKTAGGFIWKYEKN